MTTKELIELLGAHPLVLLICFAGIPVVASLLGLIHGSGKGDRSPWKYVYSVLVYAVCFPGIFAAVLTGYTLFFIRKNFLEANLLVYVLPIVSMLVTLLLIKRNVGFGSIPGFDRLSGLMLLIAVTFVLALAIEKTRIWLFFGGPFSRLIILVGVLFLLLKWGSHKLFRNRHEEKKKRSPLSRE